MQDPRPPGAERHHHRPVRPRLRRGFLMGAPTSILTTPAARAASYRRQAERAAVALRFHRKELARPWAVGLTPGVIRSEEQILADIERYERRATELLAA